MQLQGTIVDIQKEKQVTDNYKIREFVVEDLSNMKYPQYYQFKLSQDKCSMIDSHAIGEAVIVKFSVEGKKWTNKEGKEIIFTTLAAYSIVTNNDAPQEAAPQPQKETAPQEEGDDLPF